MQAKSWKEKTVASYQISGHTCMIDNTQSSLTNIFRILLYNVVFKSSLTEKDFD